MSKWKIVRLEEVATYINGYAFKPQNWSKYGLPIIRIQNLTNSSLEINYYNGDIPEKYIISNGDILISWSASLGVYEWNKGKAVLNQHIFKVVFDKIQLNKKYFLYVVDKLLTNISGETHGSTMKHITKPRFNNLPFPLPPLEEQHKIASTLDTVSELLKLRKQQLDELDLLVKSRFVEMFGENGKPVSLPEYIWFQEGPGVRSVDFTTNGTILLTGSNINNNEITFGYKSDRFISNEMASGRYSHFICDKGDILVVSSAIDPVKFDKKVVIVSEDKKYCLNTGIIRFKPNEKYLTKTYFMEFLKTNYFKNQVINEMRGIAQMHFGPSHLKEMTILLPDSKERQEQFSDFVKQVDSLKSEVQKSINETQTLFDSLMQEYFE